MIWWIVSALGIGAIKSWCFRGKNAVWGGATIGLVIGAVVAIFRPGVRLETIGHSIVIGAFVGLVAEALGWLGDRLKRDA